MKEYWKYKRGSEWRRWDLHIHSDASDGKMDCEQIINKAIENKIDVIALTDHHTFKNIDTIKTLAKDKNISVISGIEFRTEYGKKSVHILALFPDFHKDIPLNSKNLTDLILSPLGLAEINIITKGKQKLLEEGKTEFSNEEAFKKGMFLVQVDFKKAANLVHEYGGLIIPHAGQKENGIDREMYHQGKPDITLYNSLGTVKEELFTGNYIDICEISKENDNENFYLEKFKKPSIISSDAHKINQVGSKFTWIKADPTFEGLKQILYEPKDRVRIQSLKPEQKNEQYIISKIEFKSSDKLFGNKEIFLNENLNSIIGGKSSGKSLLLHSIAESIDPNQVERISKRLGFDGYKFNEDFDFEVTWKNGDKDKLKDRDPDNKNHKITYIPQLYINYLAEKNNKEELNSLVGNILLQDTEFKSFYEFRINQIEKISKTLETELFDLLSYRDDYLKFAKELKEIGLSKSISEAIKKLEEQIKTIHKLSNLSQEDLKKYNKLIEEKEKLGNKLELIKTKEIVLNEFVKELNETKNELFGIQDEVDFLSKKGRLEKLLDNFKEIPSDIRSIHDILKSDYNTLISKLSNEISKLNLSQQSKDITEKIKVVDDTLKPYVIKFEGQKEIRKIDEKLKLEKEKKAKAEMLEKKLKSLTSEYTNTKKRIKKLLSDRYILYQEIVADINSKRNKIGSDITLQCSLLYKKSKFSLYDQANKAAISQNNKFHNLFTENYVNYDLIPDFFIQAKKVTEDNFLNVKIDNDKYYKIPLKQNTSIDEIFRGIITDNFELDYKVTYKNDELLNMSPGKKGTVLLILFLQISSAEYPILIDQPEDNLDNRTIYELLCKMVKETKTKRQIIIVSHNANLVVSTDSENIIVANQEGQDPDKDKSEHRFEYVNGAIEFSSPRDDKIKGVLYQQGIKEHVCDILEGGNEAFKQREKKYAI